MDKRPKDGWKLKRDSLTKLVIYYSDGNVRTFYSLDWKSRYSPWRSRKKGLTGLLALVGKHGPMSDAALVYDNGSGQELYKFFRGEPMKPTETKTNE